MLLIELVATSDLNIESDHRDTPLGYSETIPMIDLHFPYSFLRCAASRCNINKYNIIYYYYIYKLYPKSVVVE